MNGTGFTSTGGAENYNDHFIYPLYPGRSTFSGPIPAIDLALRPKGIADNNSYEKKLAAMIRKAKGLPKLTEIGTIFAASERQVDITGPGIAKAKPGQKLLVRTSMGDYTLITENNMHTKLVAKSSPAAAARLKKGDKVFLK